MIRVYQSVTNRHLKLELNTLSSKVWHKPPGWLPHLHCCNPAATPPDYSIGGILTCFFRSKIIAPVCQQWQRGKRKVPSDLKPVLSVFWYFIIFSLLLISVFLPVLAHSWSMMWVRVLQERIINVICLRKPEILQNGRSSHQKSCLCSLFLRVICKVAGRSMTQLPPTCY